MSNPDKIVEDSKLFQLKAKNSLNSFDKSEMDNLKGLSGGGIFKRGVDGEIFLIGIQYAYGHTIHLKCFDLREIIKEINEKLDIKIPLGEYSIFGELGVDERLLTFGSLEEIFEQNKEIQRIKKREDEVSFLLENNWRNKKLDKNYNKLKVQMKNIAEVYFYRGKVFFESHDMQKAYSSFSRAIELYPTYKSYFAKDEFSKPYLTNAQKEAREKLKDELGLSKNSELQEKILEDNIETNKKNYDKLEKSYRELILFYYRNFIKYRTKIIDLLKKLAKIKILNQKPIEAEKILLEARGLEVERNHKEINILLINLYISDIYMIQDCVSYRDIYLKLIELQVTFETTSKYYTFITNKISKINIYKSYENDCFIEHLELQRREIKELKKWNNYYIKELEIIPEIVVENSIQSNNSLCWNKIIIFGGVVFISLILSIVLLGVDFIENFLR